jgi:hypothetical protein
LYNFALLSSFIPKYSTSVFVFLPKYWGGKLSNASKKAIKIKQNGRSNASFYPDLPRQVALKVAVNANPIEWNFELLDDNTLKGKKSTLISANEDAIPGIIDVTWHRRS